LLLPIWPISRKKVLLISAIFFLKLFDFNTNFRKIGLKERKLPFHPIVRNLVPIQNCTANNTFKNFVKITVPLLYIQYIQYIYHVPSARPQKKHSSGSPQLTYNLFRILHSTLPITWCCYSVIFLYRTLFSYSRASVKKRFLMKANNGDL
jgi:hypothetical protein